MDIKAIEEALRKARINADPRVLADLPESSSIRMANVCSALEEVLEYMKTLPALPTVNTIDTKGLQSSLNILKSLSKEFASKYPQSTMMHIADTVGVLEDLKKQIDAQTRPKGLPRWKCHKVVKAAMDPQRS